VNKHPYEELILPKGGKLLFTPCPGTKSVSLEASVKQLKQNGTSMLITLMHDDEMATNSVISLPNICRQHKMTWLQLPIVDDEAPSHVFELQWKKHKKNILIELENKGVVAVHCKGGTGRTGTVIALILLALGWTVSEIIKEVRSVRPEALKIKKQLDYLNNHLVTSKVHF